MNKLWSCSLLAVVLFATGTRSVLAVQGYYLKQKAAYHGLADIRTSSLGTKINAKDLTIFQSPNGTATVYNNSNKKYCVLPRKTWIDQFGSHQILGPIKKGGSTTIAGVQAIQYWVDGYTVERKGAKPEFQYRTEFFASTSFAIPKPVQDDFCKLVGLPGGFGMPLRVIRHKGTANNASQTLNVETYEVRPITLTSADLAPPAGGYKLVSDEMEVIMGDSEDELDALLNDKSGGRRQLPALRRNR